MCKNCINYERPFSRRRLDSPENLILMKLGIVTDDEKKAFTKEIYRSPYANALFKLMVNEENHFRDKYGY